MKTTLQATRWMVAGCGGDKEVAPGNDGGPGGGGDGMVNHPHPDLGGSDGPGPGCVPQCSGKTCGDDGCGNVCGACDPTQLCTGGVCMAPSGSTALTVDPTAG